MSAPGGVAWAIVACLPLAVGGCKKKKTVPPPASEDARPTGVAPITWVVDQVGIELVAMEGVKDPHDLDASGFARRVGRGLRASPYVVASEGDAPTTRTAVDARFTARISYGVIPEGSTSTPAMIVTVEATLSPLPVDSLELTDNVITERPLKPSERGAALTAIITEQAEKAIDAMVAGIVAKEALRDANTAELKTALSGEVDIVLWALAVIEHRRHRPSLDDVAALFSSADRKVGGAAITAAVAIGDPAALEPLTRMADFQDHDQLRVIIEASAALGGPDAIEFLEFVVTGHDDEGVKEHAADALKRVAPVDAGSR